MDTLDILRELAIIIVFAKVFGIFARMLKAPQVVGEIIAGIVIGPSFLGWVQNSDYISVLAEIGVILLMFSAGLGTSIQGLLKTGVRAFIIALCGVFAPLVMGALLYSLFYGFAPWGSEDFYKAVFIGVILTATSVSITVQTLRELGKLTTEVGTTILNAAIIDDVIGIIVLTVVIGFKDPSQNPGMVLLKVLLYFVFAILVGFLVYKLFKKLDAYFPHTRRIPILALAFCFGMAYIAEHYFGIADITGAYVAGIILCSVNDAPYIEEKMDISSYMIFGPIFFASIGLKTDITNINTKLLVFSLAFVAVGLVGKIIGCGLSARALKFSWPDSLKVGVGMMTRGEVALIVSQTGLSANMISGDYFSSVILLIIISSILTPILLKVIYTKWPEDGVYSVKKAKA